MVRSGLVLLGIIAALAGCGSNETRAGSRRGDEIRIRVTADPGRLLTHPGAKGAGDLICRIPAGTDLKVLDLRVRSSGVLPGGIRMPDITWFKVAYRGKTGWINQCDTNVPLARRKRW